MPLHRLILAAMIAAAILPAQVPSAFDAKAGKFLNQNCVACHNDRMSSGGLSLGAFSSAASIPQFRDGWTRIVQKVRSGEMPPKGLPRPALADIQGLAAYIDGELERADLAMKPDPGRVTARRLNRAEYSNTIRDLLGVEFRAEKDFPSDDSGYGFDNIGDVLTISPVLMEKYVMAAESIAARALGNVPLPKPLEAMYHSREKKTRRVNVNTIEATHRVEWDAEYTVRIGLPGERPDGKPVTLTLWMDGKPIASKQIETKPSGLVYFNPYSEEDFRVFLPEGEHTFRAGFVGDDFVKTLDEKAAASDKKNKWMNMMTFVGPYPVKEERQSRKRILVCDPASGAACVDRILAMLARRAYRRPVTKVDVASLAKFVALAKAEGQSPEQGIQLAVQAMLVSPHFLFRIERDVNPTDPTRIHRITDLELASRLSYFLWSSTPDEGLLSLAEAGKLKAPAVLEAQVKRLLADARSAALADNFAGQWLETRNLDSVKPDPQKFPEWGPDLRDAMKAETRMFFEAFLRENRPIIEFLDSKYTFLNDRLAKHYGIAGVEGPEFRKVELAGDQRGGILSHASVLTVSSYPTRTSPVIRGKYVLQNILGVPPPPPPPDVPALDEEQVGAAASLRQQLEKHRSNAVCASCHSRMDVLGFGLENYDGIGQWRTMDGKFPVDSSGTLPNGKSFTSPAGMRTLMRDELPDFARCLTEKMLTYALGRGLEPYDRRTVAEINKNLAASGYRLGTLVSEIVGSLPFQQRRGETPRSDSKPKPKEVALR